MSALLPISEGVYELNLCAEHGYTYRNFKRAVRVYQSADYKSVLFLVYATYKHTLPNRKTPYRNHFTLYRNADTVVVVRSETTLRFQDHDAALQYDVIKPTESYRATTTECDWTVSFDKIQYSNTRPSFLSYTLVCSGEWWYFENGVILNGITAYEKDITCGHMFIYYELHPKYNIVTPLSQNYRTSAQTRLLSMATASSSLPSFLEGRTEQRQQPNLNPPTTTTGSQAATTTTTTTTAATTPSCNPRTQLCSFLTNRNAHTADSGFNVIQATTLNSNIAPIVNALARPIIQTNDAQEVPDLDTKTVVPSMFWFVQRSKELNAKCISYFLPKDFKTTPDMGGSNSFLNNAYYNMGLPVVPLPQLNVMSEKNDEQSY